MFQIYKNFNNLMSLYGKQKLNNGNFYARINYLGGSVLINQIMNRFRTISDTVLPIDSELVAAGEGALSILIANLDSLISKSSNKPPVLSHA